MSRIPFPLTARTALLGALLVLGSACSRAPEPRPSRASAELTTPPAEAGLLVALSNGRTTLLAADGDSMRVVATREALVVPDSGGWWFVESVERCTTEEYGPEDGWKAAFVHSNQVLVVARAGGTGQAALQGTDCGEAARQVTAARERRYRAALVAARGDSSRLEVGEEEDDGYECRVATERVTWLSPAAISVERRDTQTPACHPMGSTTTSGLNAVTRLGAGTPVALRSLLSPPVRAASERAFATAEGCTFDDDRSPELMDHAWAVHRAGGAWVADLWIDGPNACRGMHDIDLSVPLPASFTDAGTLPVPFDTLRARRPAVRDAAAAPSGTLVALLEGDTLAVVRVRDHALARTLVRVPGAGNANFLMLRWAGEAEVARWGRELPALRAPRIVVTPPSEPR